MAAATSSGAPNRPNGIAAKAWAWASPDMAECRPGALRMIPGTTQLTVMPSGASCAASGRVSATSAAWAAVVARKYPAAGRNTADRNDPVLTTRPAGVARRCGRVAAARFRKARALTAMASSNPASSSSPNGRRSARPATWTTWSSRPRRATASATSTPSAPGAPKGWTATAASAPAARSSAATASAPSRLLPAWTSSARPGTAIMRHSAAPMPEPPPVTTATVKTGRPGIAACIKHTVRRHPAS
jgi:hypothetical protein